MMALIRAWEGYAAAHLKQHGDVIGTDGYAAPYMEEIAHGINGLLSMDLGRLDGGTLSAHIYAVAKDAGLDEREL